jgi:hypothetical protein
MLFEFLQKEAPTIGEIAAKPRGIVVQGLWTADDEHDYFRAYRYGSEADAVADTDATDLDDEIRSRKYRDDDDLEDDAEYWYRFSSVDKWGNESEKSAAASAVYRLVLKSDVRPGDMTDQKIGQDDSSITVDDGAFTDVISVTSEHGSGATAVTLIGQFKNNSGSEIEATVQLTGDAQGEMEEWLNFVMPPRVLLTVIHLYENPIGAESTFRIKVKLESGSAGLTARKLVAISNKR